MIKWSGKKRRFSLRKGTVIMRRMVSRMLAALAAGVLFFLMPGCNGAPENPSSDPNSVHGGLSEPEETDQPELRGVWVSYMELNTLLSGRTAQEAKTELDTLLDNCVSWHLNAVFFHVRANSDAYYASEIFAPAPAVASLLEEGFDPLSYVIEGAHQRGLQLHAWVNPYRIGTDESYKRCDDVFECGGRYYYIPSSIKAQKLILDGVREIVDRYAVDGVQYDDYFYPSGGVPEEEPADFEQEAFSASGMKDVGDWRRTQVDALVRATREAVHRREGCVFGVSPAASMTSNAQTLYADVAKWTTQAGYVDYMCPQIYFGFENSANPFDKALESWLSLDRDPSVRLYVGLALYKAGTADDAYAGEGRTEWSEHSDILRRSAELVRSSGLGMVFFSYRYFDPAAVGELSGENLEIAVKEVENLLSVLAAGESENTGG